MEWNQQVTTKKGDFAESLIQNYYEEQGFNVYKATAVNKSHPFDFMIAARDKKEIFFVDVKAKAKRKFFNDNGIDLRFWNEYLGFGEKYNTNFIIFFVDEEQGKIYFQTIQHLNKLKNKILDGMIYFDLSEMIILRKLMDSEIQTLKSFTTKKGDYSNDESYKKTQDQELLKELKKLYDKFYKKGE